MKRSLFRTGGLAAILLALIGLGFLISGCRSLFAAPTPTPTAPPPTPTLTIAQRNPIIWDAWAAGPHGAAYDLGKGPNTYCARCHSPANWDPAAVIDPPPNCVSCKFPFDETVRMAQGNPLIPEEDWRGIDCAACHFTGADGIPQAALAWHDAATGYSESIATPTDLCNRCHQDTPSLQYRVTLDGVTHPGFECTSCHEPHTATAACGAVGCHNEVVAVLISYSPLHEGVSANQTCLGCHPEGMRLHSMEINQKGTDDCLGCHQNLVLPPSAPGSVTAGHALYHKDVDCVACHDASGLAIKPIEGQERWTTFRTTLIEALGRPVESTYTSHNLQRQVDCARCHFAGNPWGLKESVDGTRP